MYVMLCYNQANGDIDRVYLLVNIIFTTTPDFLNNAGCSYT